ncbi:unnamed protein product [Tilletia controversa]|nr:unnamed protein product [Tilletia controversa]
MYASSRDAVRLGPFGSSDTLWNSASPTNEPPPNVFSRPFQSEWVDRSEGCEPEFISDLRPIPTMDHATCSPPPTPSSFRPWGFDSLGEVSDSGWTEWDALAAGPTQNEIDTKHFWTKHAAPAVTPPEILVPERDTFSAQLEKGSLSFQAGSSTDLGPLDDGSFTLNDDSGLVIDPDPMLASAHFADHDDDVFLPSSHHEAGAEYPSTAPTTHNHISDSPAGSEFSPNIRPFLPLASSPFLPTAASSYGNGNSKSFSRPVHHPDPAPKYDDSEDYLYDGVDDSFFEFLDATANMKDFGNAASSNDTTMLDSSF